MMRSSMMLRLVSAMLLLSMMLLTAESHRHHPHHRQHHDDQQRDEFDQTFRRRFNKMPTAAERFRFFDDYLLSIREKTKELEEPPPPPPSPPFRLPEPNEYFEGEVTAEQQDVNEPTSTSTTAGLETDRDQAAAVDQQDSFQMQKAAEQKLLDRIQKDRTTPKFACCALGQLAGNHGYHCNARFYQHRIQMRNRNRAQTRQAALEEIEREPDYNEHVWHTFGNCVRKHAKSFHHCCYAARVLGSDSVDLHNYELKRM